MGQQNNIEVHETAFVTSTFRSYDEDLSKDPYAKLWNNPKTEILTQEYLKKVSSEETYAHCLRNRYFFDQIKENIENNNVEVLINFGAGFSMYPFMLDEKLINIEIDKTEIVDYKKSQVNKWQNNNTLPKRNIHFIGVDFNQEYENVLLSKINRLKGNKKSFILIEGVLFFLKRKETDKLFDFFNKIQTEGEFIGSASFQNKLKKTLAFRKLLNYMKENFLDMKEEDCLTIQDEYYQSRKGYQLIDHQDYFSLSERYQNKIRLEKELILNENFYLLEKRNFRN